MSEIYPYHVYIYAVLDGVTVSIFKALNVSAESAEMWKKDAEEKGFLYNIIQNGKIIEWNHEVSGRCEQADHVCNGCGKSEGAVCASLRQNFVLVCA